jgi:hypothetical protein
MKKAYFNFYCVLFISSFVQLEGAYDEFSARR